MASKSHLWNLAARIEIKEYFGSNTMLLVAQRDDYQKRYRTSLRTLLIRSGYHSRPSFLIIGAQKAGTKALHAYLSAHPLIVPAKVKEIHFFSMSLAYSRGYAWYHAHFPLPHRIGRNSLTFEAAPSYLYIKKAAERIHAYDSKMRLIALIRNPIDRAYSQWNMYRLLLQHHPQHWRRVTRDADEHTRSWVDNILDRNRLPSFEQAIQNETALIAGGDDKTEPSFLRRGLYYNQIVRFLEFFDRDQLLIIDSEDLKRNTADVLKRVTMFLRLTERRWHHDELRLRHVRKYENPMEGQTRIKLRNFYAPHNEKLYDMLGKDLGWEKMGRSVDEGGRKSDRTCE